MLIEQYEGAYSAVVIDEAKPLHGHVSYMTPPEQDFTWGRDEEEEEEEEEDWKEV